MRKPSSSTRVRERLLLLAVLAWFLLQNPSLMAQQRKAPEKIESGSSCLAEGCHKNLQSGKMVHYPLEEGDDSCELCHEAEGDRHAFFYPAKGAELCYACHESVTEKKLLHFPLKDEDTPCTVCHNPHSSSNEKLLRYEKTNDLCLDCHDDVAQGGLYHDAEKIDACTACHEPHSSDTDSHLRTKTPALCYSCHRDIKDRVGAEGAMIHGPVSMGCATCHDAHKKLAGKGLAKASPALCVDCHDDFESTVADMSARHHLLIEGKNCANCHDSHVSEFDHLLSNDTQTVCLSCHNEDVKSATGEIIKNLKDVLAEDVHRHGPGKSLDCAACHEPHAGKEFRFLRGQYPQKLYSPYSSKAYSLCFNCHDESLAAADTTEETGFRDGQRNLHYVHVNKQRKGRTCRACHSWHVSSNTQMLAESVPFGQWRIPVNFTASEDGGSCNSGCHRSQAYSRAPPASDPTPAPPLPSETGAAAEEGGDAK